MPFFAFHGLARVMLREVHGALGWVLRGMHAGILFVGRVLGFKR